MSNLFRQSNLFHIELSIISFNNYIRLVEENFRNTVKNLQDNYESVLVEIDNNKNKYEEQYQEHLKDSLIDEMYEIEVEYIQRFRSSIIIQLFSFLEVELKTYCEIHSQNQKKEYSIHDLKGNNELDKIKKYLKHSANVEIDKIQPGWNFINNIRKLRNRIVHGESVIMKSHGDFKELQAFSSNNFTLKRQTAFEYAIVLDKRDFIENAVKEVGAFLKAIIYKDKILMSDITTSTI